MKNEYKIVGEVTEIYLRRRSKEPAITTIDTEDLPKLLSFGRTVSIMGEYAIVWNGTKSVRLHRFLTDPPDGVPMDHINLNKLDNRKANLRLATTKLNGQNLPVSRNTMANIRGVVRKKNKWCAQVKLNGVSHYLGGYDTIAEAAEVSASFRCENMPYSEMDKGANSVKPVFSKIGNPNRYTSLGRRKNRWEAYVVRYRKNIYVGSFPTEELARAAAIAKRDAMFPLEKEAA